MEATAFLLDLVSSEQVDMVSTKPSRSSVSAITSTEEPPINGSAEHVSGGEDANASTLSVDELQLRRKVDWRLCTIAGILCSLNLLDSGIISSASVTSMLSDLSLTGNRYSVAIL